MNIQLQNCPGLVFSTQGPNVEFQLADQGQANVVIHLALSDGTHIHYPDGSGSATTQSTVLPPGDYVAMVMITAISQGAFGPGYQSTLRIGGSVAAKATGAVPAGSDADDDRKAFTLRVA